MQKRRFGVSLLRPTKGLATRYLALCLGLVMCASWLGCGAPVPPAHPAVGVTGAGEQPLESCGLPYTPQPRSEHPAPGPGLGVLTQANACGPGSAQEPPPRTYSTPPEGYTSYVGQTQCSPTAKPGMAAFRDLILKTYPCTGDFGISRACSSGGQSEHKEGRAWDWKLNYPHPAADAVINWLLATRNGVAHAYVRRLGLMYMIWNRKIWKAYQASKGWQAYTGASPHTDHIHFSFSRDGGDKKTSFWQGSEGTATKLDAKFITQGATGALGASGGAQYSLCPGQPFSFFFKVENTGNINWTDVNKTEAGRAVRLGFRKDEGFGAPTRISVNTTPVKDVKPGASVTFTIDGKAPTKAGVYRSEWQLVSELVTWFGPDMWQTFHVTSTPPGEGQSCQVQGQGGDCGQGVMKCTAKGLSCVGDTSSPEVCDNKDNDCNGQIDDGLTRPCYGGPDGTQGVGRCRSGTETCQAGQWGTCVGAILPEAKEICGNTIDDNCNGQVDEGCGDEGCEDKDGDGYGVGKGCGEVQDCNDNDKTIYPGAPEICGNGIDEDCRGGDRPCQSTVPHDTPEDINADGGTGADDRLQICPNPPCDVTTLKPPDQGPAFKPGGCGCSTTPQDPGPTDVWWFLCCLGLGGLAWTRSQKRHQHKRTLH